MRVSSRTKTLIGAIAFSAAVTAGSLSAAPAHVADDPPLKFARLELTDGRKLTDVVVKSYDAKSERLLIVTKGKAMTIPLALLPPPLNQQLRAAPASGESVSTIVTLRPLATAAEQYSSYTEVVIPAGTREPVVLPSRPAPVIHGSPGAAAGSRSATDPVQGNPSLAPATLARHEAAARSRAEKYFRYEYMAGSNSIKVTELEFELSTPKPVPGWEGRYQTEGKAFLEYFDSKGRSFQRATSTFEVTTEQKHGEGLTIVDFSRRS